MDIKPLKCDNSFTNPGLNNDSEEENDLNTNFDFRIAQYVKSKVSEAK